MADNPLDPATIEIFRQRILTDVGRLRAEVKDAPSFEDVEALYNKAAFVSNKANIVARAISKVAEKYSIPVDPEDTEVVAAVKRKSADSSDGLTISFDLFKDAVKFFQTVRKSSEETVVLSQSFTTGSVLQKRMRKIRARASLLIETGTEPDDKTLELLVSQFLILYVAHQLMKPFEGMDHLKLAQTWLQKRDGGSEAEIALSILIGLAMQFFIMGLNEEKMELYLNEAAGNVFPGGFTARQIIQKARAYQKTKSEDLAEKMIGLNDYELILRYANEFLGLTIDPGYDFWVAYVETVQLRYSAQNIWVQAPHYSVSHAIVTQTFSGNKTKPTFKKGDRTIAFNTEATNNELIKIEFKKAIVDSLVPMATSSYVARVDALEGMNDNLDLITQVLSSDFAIEIAYCIGKFLGKLDPSVLKALRAILEGLLRAYRFDIRDILSALIGQLINPNFAEEIALLAMQQIDKIFDKVVSKVLGLFGDDINALLCCPFLGEFVEKILQGIVRIESELKGAIKIFLGKMLKSIEIGSIDLSLRYEQKHEERIIRKMILILDAVIQQIEAFNAATNPLSPIPESIRYNTQLPTLSINDDEKTNYFYTALPRELSTGKFIPGIGEKITGIVTESFTDAVGRISGKHSCSTAFTEEELIKAANSFKGTK